MFKRLSVELIYRRFLLTIL